MQLAAGFETYLSAARIAEARDSRCTVVGLFPDFRVGFWNDAAARFYAVNGGEGGLQLGVSVVDVVADPRLRSFYRDLFLTVQNCGAPADHDYECSSPQTYRRFRLRVYPLPEDGLLLRHLLTVEQPHPRASAPRDERIYRDDNGFIVQCSHCRCTRRADDRATWDWVPDYVARMPPETSHGLCKPCFRHYFPAAAES